MVELKILLAVSFALSAVSATAAPLTVRPGESWAFRLAHGDPVKAHKVSASAKPAKGEIIVSVRSFLGTMMTAVNGTGRGWTFKAELVSGGKANAARTCTLPASRNPIIEQWSGKTADAVRISRFVPAKGGNC